MELNQEVQNSIRKILKSKPEVLACYFYGSRAKGKNLKSSDVDLVLVVDRVDKKEYENIYLEIDKYFKNIELDLRMVTSKDRGVFLFQVLKYGKCIYERDELERIRFETSVLDNFYDSKHIRDIYDYYLRKVF